MVLIIHVRNMTHINADEIFNHVLVPKESVIHLFRRQRAGFAVLQVRFGNICGENPSVHQFIHYTCTHKSVLLIKHSSSGHAAPDFCFLAAELVTGQGAQLL